MKNLYIILLLAYSACSHGQVAVAPAAVAPAVAVSSQSSWVGATVGYNFQGKSTDNVIAGARVRLNEVEQFKTHKHFDLLVIGNISKITSSGSDSIAQEVNSIIQSTQGLSVGISPIWTINPDNADSNFFRLFATANYKLNAFKDIGIDRETINIGQGRFTLGFEFEGFEVVDGGKFNFNLELGLSVFEEDNYYKVFCKHYNSITSLESSLIIPISGKFGIMTSYTMSNRTKPVFQAGFLIRSE